MFAHVVTAKRKLAKLVREIEDICNSTVNNQIHEQTISRVSSSYLLEGRIFLNWTTSFCKVFSNSSFYKIHFFFQGTHFKETHYKRLNGFLEEKRELFQSFIAKITNVSGLEFQLDMYNLLKYKRERPVTVQTTYNQILVIHRVKKKN